MFTSITNRKSFGATYTWAILSVLPMDNGDDGIAQEGLRPTDINAALGMPNALAPVSQNTLRRWQARV